MNNTNENKEEARKLLSDVAAYIERLDQMRPTVDHGEVGNDIRRRLKDYFDVHPRVLGKG